MILLSHSFRRRLKSVKIKKIELRKIVKSRRMFVYDSLKAGFSGGVMAMLGTTCGMTTMLDNDILIKIQKIMAIIVLLQKVSEDDRL